MEFHSFYKSFDNRKYVTWCKHTKRLDTYGCGCQHDCHYCYAKSLLSFRGLWGNPRRASVYKIKNRIKRLNRNEVVKLGGMTDCFQPVERKEMITYKTILILNQFRIHYLIVTKNSLVSDDRYIKIYDKKLAHFQITITSTHPVEYEKAPMPDERIEAVEKLHELGFDVSVRLSPFIEQNIDFSILNSIQCNKILIEFLKVSPFIRKSFDIDYSEYTLKYGGYNHLELHRKIDLVNKVIGFSQVSVGEYVQDHHVYFRDNVNYNKADCCNLNEIIFETHKQLKLFTW